MALVDPAPQSSRLNRRYKPHFQMARVVGALILREMATTYGKSAGGYIWAVLEPVLGIALLSFMFSLALHTPALGTNFPLFYASGFLPFAMTISTINKIGNAVSFSRPFMAYPCVTFIDTIVARLVLAALTHAVVIAIVLVGIITVYNLPFWLDVPSLFMSLSMAMMLATGIGTLNCYLLTAFPVYGQIWSIATRPLFLISGVFFTYDSMPPLAQHVLWYNPLIHVVGLMRRGLYPTYHSDYISIPYLFVISLITLFFGLLLLGRHFKTLMEG